MAEFVEIEAGSPVKLDSRHRVVPSVVEIDGKPFVSLTKQWRPKGKGKHYRNAKGVAVPKDKAADLIAAMEKLL